MRLAVLVVTACIAVGCGGQEDAPLDADGVRVGSEFIRAVFVERDCVRGSELVEPPLAPADLCRGLREGRSRLVSAPARGPCEEGILDGFAQEATDEAIPADACVRARIVTRTPGTGTGPTASHPSWNDHRVQVHLARTAAGWKVVAFGDVTSTTCVGRRGTCPEERRWREAGRR